MNNSRKQRITSGFSLIELLVVIAIIATLAAILFPVFVSARASARRTTCQSNERQIGLAIAQYVQDHDGLHPPYYEDADSDAPVGWTADIGPYVRSANLFHCPDQTVKPTPNLANNYSDYGYNRYLLGLPESSIVAPSNTILVLDCILTGMQNWDDGSDDGPTAFDCKGDSSDPHAAPAPAMWLTTEDYAKRHRGGADYLFADGHVKWYQPLSVFNNCTAPTGKPTFAYK